VHAHRHPTRALAEVFRLLGRYGVAWVRLWWGWNLAQLSEKEPLDLSEFDRELALAERSGLRVMPCLTLVYWKMKSLERGDFTYWNRFVAAVVRRYRGRVKLWEIWNEPAMVPRDKLLWYVELCKNTYQVARQLDPQCQLSACSPGEKMNPNVWNSMARIRDFLQLGGSNYCDYIGLHPYASVNAPVWQDLQGSLDRIRRWIEEAGGHQKVLITEAGPYSSQAGYLKDDHDIESATHMVQNWLIAAVNHTIYFHFAANASALYAMNMFDPELVPNAVFCAMNGLAEQLRGAKDFRWLRVNRSTGGVLAIGWQKDDEKIVALWCQGKPEPRLIRLKLPCDQARLIDMFGNPGSLGRTKQSTLVPVRRTVSYLHLTGLCWSEVEEALAEATELPVTDELSD